jgi:hypothetical protein
MTNPFPFENNIFEPTNKSESDIYDYDLYSLDNLNQSISSVFNISLAPVSSINLLFEEQNADPIIASPIFRTGLPKMKRGRKSENNSKKETHDSKSYDNILIKIQVHYMNFIISFINDCIRAFNKSKKLFFKKFNTDIKKNVSKMSFDSIKNSTINEILSNIKISRKYKKFDPYYNKVNLNILLKDDWFKKLFGMKFLDLFRYYYNDKEPFTEILLFDKIITLSKDTKPFFKLIERNKEISQRIIEITEIDYLNRKYQIETDKLVEDYSDGNLNQQEANNSNNLRNE